jgi:hypothetical protein
LISGQIKLKVLSYNVWGLQNGIVGKIGGCKYKDERLQDLAYHIRSRSPKFDVFLIQELWMRKDHQILKNAVNKANLYMTKINIGQRWNLCAQVLSWLELQLQATVGI